MSDEENQEDELQGDALGEDEEGSEGDLEGGGLNAKKIVLMFVLPLFVLIGVGGGLFFTGTLDGLLGKDKAGEQHAEESGGHGEKDSHGKKKDKHGDETQGASNAHFLEIPNMIVNLGTADGQPRYLRLSVQLEFETMADMQSVESVMPRVVDQFQTYLRELRVKDLRGSAGIYRLQMELLSRVNAAAYPVEVKDVLFQEILIQ